MENKKIASYLGLSLRARKIVLGVDDIENKNKGVFVLLYDEGIAENSLKKIVKAKDKFSCPLIAVEKETLGALLHRPAVKAVGVTDKNLAEAIVANVDGKAQFKFYFGGND